MQFHIPYSNPCGVCITHYYTHIIFLVLLWLLPWENQMSNHHIPDSNPIKYATKPFSALSSVYLPVGLVDFLSIERWIVVPVRNGGLEIQGFIFIKQLVHYVRVLNTRPVVLQVNWSSPGSEQDPGVRPAFICTPFDIRSLYEVGWTSGSCVHIIYIYI